jgi:hypothetical protein
LEKLRDVYAISRKNFLLKDDGHNVTQDKEEWILKIEKCQDKETVKVMHAV